MIEKIIGKLDKKSLNILADMLEKIRIEYNVKVYYDSNLYDNEATTDGESIYVGSYDDEQKMFLSIFHELAHLRLDRETKELFKFSYYTIELLCWNLALIEASKMGIFFEDETIEWGFEEARGYSGRTKREYTKEGYERIYEPMFEIWRKLRNEGS